MISVQEALRVVLDDLPLVEAEVVALTQACGRVLAEEVVSGRDVPPFANSAMDGYAVRAGDVAVAPTTLRVIEVVAAGAVPTQVVAPGTATQIMTGAVMPEGADTVVRLEDSEEGEASVRVLTAVQAGANVRFPGEDLRCGEVVLTCGRRLAPADVGLLASVGRAVVMVRRRPRVAILATGDELVELGQPLLPGQIVNSNAYTLAAAVTEAGAAAQVLGIVCDDEALSRVAFERALAADIVLSTGGVSMGVFDLVRGTLARLGVEEKFWKVAQKPGKPLTFGRRGATCVFGLPGNPVSALVCFYVYVLPALRTMLGLTDIHLPVVTATASEDIRAATGVTDFIRCFLERDASGYRARATGTQSSGVLRSMALGQGLIVAGPELAEIKSGSAVSVIRLAEEWSPAPPLSE